MLVLLSPAKTLDFENLSPTNHFTKPDFLDFSNDLIKGLSKLSSVEIESLMRISPKLARLNQDRFQAWKKEHKAGTSKQAVVAFKGDVYEGLQAWNFNPLDFEFAQSNLRILSGLYGILKPLDLIQPYRLEMGTVYANPAGKDLYSFWGNRLAKSITEDLKITKSQTIINLASLEYSKAAQLNKVDAQIISPVFKDEKNGKFKIISFYAKRARGLMANFLISNQIKKPEGLKRFAANGYVYSEDESTLESPVFTRSEKQRAAA
ncbi:peroxide stress protein YaaA [Opitutales bacterium]|nr:peroxide stress protein YaaA [Opitutales bacterium]